MKQWIVLIGFALITSAPAAEPELAGDWAFSLPDSSPVWLRIPADLSEEGLLLWSVGKPRPAQNFRAFKGGVEFEAKARWKPWGKGEDFWQMHNPMAASLNEDGTLNLIGNEALVGDPESARPRFLAGVRIPRAPERPDLTQIKFAEGVALLNGEDLAGWKLTNPEKKNGWSVVDGVLVNETPKEDFGAYGEFGNLATEKEFGDFRLTLEYNVPKDGNSGVYLRGMAEAQVVDRDSRMQGIAGPGAVFGRIEPSENAANPGGKWNRYVLTLVDRHITVELNGKVVIDNALLEGPTGGGIKSHPDAPGPIFLQGDHTSVNYRNIVIEERE